jgi:hypothetical protein
MKAQSIGKKANTGMSTLEILIAFAVLTLSIGAIILLEFGNQSVAVDSELSEEAQSKAQEILEEARATSKGDFDSVNSIPAYTDDIYTKSLAVTDFTRCLKQITSTVSWNFYSHILETDLSTILANVNEALVLGGDCASISPYGDWSNPEKLNSIDTTPTTLKATSLDVKNKIIYLSVDPTSASDPDFFIFDASNISKSSAPILASNLNTGPGLESIDVADSYAYIANDSKNGQLQIIDVNNIYNPILKTTFNVVPNGTDTNTVGTKIFYYDKTIYLGLKKNNYAEFFVIDVSNPLSPITKGSYEFNASVNSINVKGNYAYVATPNSEEVTVLYIDKNSSQFMQKIGSFDAPGGSGNGKNVKILGDKLYLGRTVGNIEFYILNINDPTNISILSSYDANTSINDMVIAGDYAYLVTSTSNSEFQILDISDSAHPTSIGKYNYGDKITGIDYENNLIFISNENQDAIIIIQPNTQ